MILMNDFRRQWEVVGPSVLKAVEEVGKSGSYILGHEVWNFEQALAQEFGLAHAVGVGNGMDAIEIGLRALGIQPNDRVLTTPLSAFATTLAILRAGAQPVFVDVDENGLIDLEQVNQVLERRKDIRFFVPVHLYGYSVDLNRLQEIRDHRKVWIVEDCAQSIGARFQERRAGSVGQISTTSFYPTKNLGAMGDGGALLTADSQLAEKAKMIRHYGQSSHYVHSELGLNSRLDEVQASILRRSFLPSLGEWTQRRKNIADLYLRGIRNPRIQLPKPAVGTSPVWHLFPVMLSPEQRDVFQAYMKSRGVSTGIHYPHLISDQKALLNAGQFEVVGKLEKARLIASSEVSLPIHPFLSDCEVDQVIEVCNQWQS